MNQPPSSQTPNRRTEAPPGPLLRLGDIYDTLFRHKWKILLSAAAGVLGAATVLVFDDPFYLSEAKLLVRYVRDSRAIDSVPGVGQGDLRSPDRGGDSIINSELEILTSRDLALMVADAVGPQKILGGEGERVSRHRAATAVLEELEVEAPRRSSVIRVSYRHHDPQVAQLVLGELVRGYLRKHSEAHRATGLYDTVLTRQTDELRSRLAQTEEELRKLKLQANVNSIPEARRAMADEVARVRDQLLTAEAELAQRRALCELLGRPATNAHGTTVAPGSASGTTGTVSLLELEVPLDPDKERQHRGLLARLDSLRNREMDLLLQFAEETSLVRQVRDQIAEVEKAKAELETQEPRLLHRARLEGGHVTPTSAWAPSQPVGVMTLAAEQAQVAALQARIAVLREQLKTARDETVRLNELEPAITELERRKQLQETNYYYFSANLEQARLNEALGSGNVPNINVVEDATIAARVSSGPLKMAALLLLAGLGGGMGLAFLLDYGLSQTVMRSEDVQRKLRLPLFLSIPDFRSPRRARTSTAGRNGAGALATADDAMQIYYEALRDRLIMHFELRELAHKPKLVGVTAVGRNAGVSSIAAGLAKALSETGDGRVLLVDMNPESGPSVHPFRRGRQGCDLTEVFEQEKRGDALVQDNLYVVSLTGHQGSRVGIIPRKFASLMPKMKASDYDYIIFDMPPVTQTSVTAKVAGLLDATLLVIESERTNVERARRSAALLAEARANLGAVLNRYHNYLPAALSSDL